MDPTIVPSSVFPLVVGSASIGGLSGGVVGAAVGGAVTYSTGNHPAGKLVRISFPKIVSYKNRFM